MTGDKTITEPSTENNDKPNDAKQTVKTSPPKKPTKESGTKPKKSGLMLLIIGFILVCGLMSAGGYYLWQYWLSYSNQQEARLQALEGNAAEQNTRVQQLANIQNAQANDQVSLLKSLQQDQQVLQQRLDSHTQRLRALAGTSRDDWLLAEARYLLRLANQRLLVERGTEGAQSLLESADSILQSVDDSAILPVRDAIAKEIIALKLAKTVDRQGLYLQLSALKSQIQELPLIPFRNRGKEAEKPTTITQDNPTTDSPETTWSQSLQKSIINAVSSLRQFVQIRHHNDAPDLLISEQQQLQVINNIQLMFEQAQFALLHEEEMIYKDSLSKALNWWNVYYSHYTEYEVIHSEIKKLQAYNIIQEIPSITRSTALLTDYIERFHQLNQEQPVNNNSEIEHEKKQELQQ